VRCFRKSSVTKTHIFEGRHRFEHWYRDNTVYFVTSRVRNAFHGNRDYFDGWLRNEKQLRKAHRYVREQAIRHGIVRKVDDMDWLLQQPVSQDRRFT
jgi:hypothetical protein